MTQTRQASVASLALKHWRRTHARSSSRRKGVRVRPATVSDADAVATLSGQLGYPVLSREMTKRIRSVARRKYQKLFVAEVQGKVVGWVEIFVHPSVLNWGKAEVGALVVDESSHRKGIGTALMHTAHAWALSKKSRFIYLRSNIRRKDAHRFYRKTGYEVHKTQYVFKLLFNAKDQGH